MSWTNSLRTPAELKSFLTGKNRMALETVSIDDERKIWMGDKTSRSLSLVDCLQKLKKDRKDHGIKLDVKSYEIFQEINSILIEYQEDWITLSFTCFQGPVGSPECPVHPEDVVQINSEWPSPRLRKGFAMTTSKETGPKSAFTTDVLTKFKIDWERHRFDGMGRFDFAIDLYPISMSEPRIADRVRLELKTVERLEVRLQKEQVSLVNMENAQSFLEKLDLEQTFFNMPDDFKSKLNLKHTHKSTAWLLKSGWLVLFIGQFLTILRNLL